MLPCLVVPHYIINGSQGHGTDKRQLTDLIKLHALKKLNDNIRTNTNYCFINGMCYLELIVFFGVCDE